MFAQLDYLTTMEQPVCHVKLALSGTLLLDHVFHAQKPTFTTPLVKDVSAHHRLHTYQEVDVWLADLVKYTMPTLKDVRAAHLPPLYTKTGSVLLALSALPMI